MIRLTFGGNVIETGTDSYHLANTGKHRLRAEIQIGSGGTRVARYEAPVSIDGQFTLHRFQGGFGDQLVAVAEPAPSMGFPDTRTT